MKINAEELQDNMFTGVPHLKTGENAYHDKASSRATSGPSGISIDLSGRAGGIGAYGRGDKDLEALKTRAGAVDEKSRKNYMVVMSNTMSGEDYKKLTQDGVNPGKIEASDAVTIMDNIKTVMARSGVVIDGFNSKDDLDIETVTNITGSPALARSITESFANKDLPVTEENVKGAMQQVERAGLLSPQTPASKQYMIENKLEPTIDNLYLAQFCAGNGEAKGAGTYFTEDLPSYIGRSAQAGMEKDLIPQMDRVIEQAGLDINDVTRGECVFLMDAGLLLTPENLKSLSQLDGLRLPPDEKTVVEAAADAILSKKAPGQASLIGGDLLAKAQEIADMTASITPEAAQKAINDNQPFTIASLDKIQRELTASLDAAGLGTSRNVSAADAASDTAVQDGLNDKVAAAKITLAEVQLRMSVSANLSLLKSGYSIDTTELTKLVEDLRAADERVNNAWGLKADDDASDTLFTETMAVRRDMYEMPAALLGRFTDADFTISIRQLHIEGKALTAEAGHAEQSYEALMTAPRADLGDSIKTAFRNVDDLIKQLGLRADADTQRAVRILGYNSMEINAENIAAVKLADATVTSLISKMNPPAVLRMIRSGINPLDSSIDELSDYFDALENAPEEAGERFSRFLYRLEQENGITEDERDAYIGVYRLLHQIEKGDGRAIGMLVESGQEISLENLLSAVRTEKKKGMEYTLDDSFGGAEVYFKGKSITDQIGGYFKKRAAALTRTLDPAALKEAGIGADSSFEKLMDAAFAQDKPASVLLPDELEMMRSASDAGEEAALILAESGQIFSAENLVAAQELVKNRGGMLRGIRDLAGKAKKDVQNDAAGEPLKDEGILPGMPELSDIFEGPLRAFTDEESAKSAYEEFVQKTGEFAEQQMLSSEGGYIDVRGASLCLKQLSVALGMSRHEDYELPAIIDGQLSSVRVRFVRDKGSEPAADINITLSDERRITARFGFKNDALTGTLAAFDSDLSDKLSERMQDFNEKFLTKTGKQSDIKVIYSESVNVRQTPDNAGGGKDAAKELYQAAALLIETLGADI